MRRKRILVGLLLLAASAVLLDRVMWAPPSAPVPPAAASSSPPPHEPAPRFSALPQRGAFGDPQGELFQLRSWGAAAPGAPARQAKPSAPPMPYRVAGQVEHENGMRVVLAKGERIYEVREGDTLEGGYRVESVKPDAVTLVYEPLATRQQLLVSGATLQIAAQPAQLRFQGPQRVRAGSPFSVALKLTSDEPVGHTPLALSFDAKRLQAVSVRPGERFADGRFSYRINEKGSIFVGASARGRAARDEDLLVVTFRPIAEGAAELAVTSLALQGDSGRAIAHQPPLAFRASIVQ